MTMSDKYINIQFTEKFKDNKYRIKKKTRKAKKRK